MAHFFQREELPAAIHGIDGLQVVVDVFLQQFLLISDFEEAAEGGSVSGCRVLGELFVW